MAVFDYMWPCADWQGVETIFQTHLVSPWAKSGGLKQTADIF